jgi:hypothetical protein
MICHMLSRAVRMIALTATALAVANCSGPTPTIEGPGAEVRALTGARTRAVWVQGDGSDPRAAGDQLVLMGFDSHDGKGERVILDTRSSYVKPLITPSGNRVVFSSRPVPGPSEVFVVNFDGSGLRTLASGVALDVWANPEDDTEWVYLGTDHHEFHFSTVSRFPIDNPARREVVWNKAPVGLDGFRVSADGTHASGMCPWPDAALVELATGSMTKLGEGCWTSLIDARGLLFWYFDGAHRNLTMVDVETGGRWMVNINHAEGFDGAEVYHPRWTNHPRFLTISGPYNQGGPNQARTGGAQVEIYAGRFSEDFATVEAWARVTNNSGGDTMPDVWIDLAESPYPRRPGGPIGPAHLRAGAGTGARTADTGDTGRLVVSVRLTRPGPIPTPQEILPYRNALVVNDYEVVDVLEGTYAQPTMPIAQWAIRDSRELAGARRAAGAAFTLTVDRYDARAELEGERLISDRGVSTLPLYYDVGQLPLTPPAAAR